MYQLVACYLDKEEILYVAENVLDVELMRQRHLRSIALGFVEIRKVEKG